MSNRSKAAAGFTLIELLVVIAIVAILACGSANAYGVWTKKTPAGMGPRRGHAMAFDSGRGKTVLFGGNPKVVSDGPDLNETWEFDGKDWNQAAPATSPPARHAFAMAYDAAHGVTVLFGGLSSGLLADTWTWDGTTWTDVTAAVGPSARYASSMAYDSARGKIVLFGGYVGATSATTNETWEWDGSAWTKMAPASSPGARYYGAMAFDSSRGKTVLFGGSYSSPPSPSVSLNDTWEYNGSTWTDVSLANRPPGGYQYGMAFDSHNNKAVLLSAGATWQWDGSAWASTSSLYNPGSRASFAMTYDSARQHTFLFGGGADTTPLNDTWSFNGTSWTDVSPAFNVTPRAAAVMAYDSARKKTVLFGGHNTTTGLRDTWEWDGLRWKNVTPSVSPTFGDIKAMAYDISRGRVVLFCSGYLDAGGYTAETWEWDGSVWSKITSAVNPPFTSDPVMAYDADRGKIVLYEQQHNTVWERTGVVWAQKSPTTTPPLRDWTGMAYAGDGKTVIFGGSGGGLSYLGDTWTWDGSNWSNLTAQANAPVGRNRHAMAYDGVHNRAFMFGGQLASPTSDVISEMWEWNNSSWLDRGVASGSARPGYTILGAMAEAPGGKVVLFGGHDYPTDTWEYYAGDFSDVSCTLTAPPTIQAGQDLTYTIVVTNKGAASGFECSLNNVLPEGTTFVSVDAPGWSVSAPAVGSGGSVDLLKTVAAGANETLHLVVHVPDTTAIGASLVHTLTQSVRGSDVHVSSRSVTATTTVIGTPSLVVTTLNESTAGDSETSLREAVAYANSNSDNSAITFKAGLSGTIGLTSALPVLTAPVDIQGPGARVLTVTRNAEAKFRIFKVAPSTSVGISGLSITNGDSDTDLGGGIYNDHGTVVLSYCTVSGNKASQGGGIASNGQYSSSASTVANLTLTGCTLSGNSAVNYGGGLHINSAYGSANATITNCTFSANAAVSGGGFGVAALGGVTAVHLDSSSLIDNTATSSGSAISVLFTTPEQVTLGNCIIKRSGSASSIDSANGSLKSLGHNLVSDSGAGFFTASGDKINTDPVVGALANNGGSTDTHALLVGSPALDAGDPAVTASPTQYDQRGPGFLRVIGGRMDIGAFESMEVAQDATNRLLVNTTDDVDDGVCGVLHCSLREAINYANSNADDSVITFAPNVIGTIELTDVQYLDLKTNISIQGPGANVLTVRRKTTGDTLVFLARDLTTTTISGLTISNGRAGIANSGNMTVLRCAIADNFLTPDVQPSSGAGINNTGTMLIQDSTISGNTAYSGGGILNVGLDSARPASMTLRNCTISGNKATGVGSYFGGGAIENLADAQLTLEQCTITANSAHDTLYDNRAGIRMGGGSLTISNTIVAGNAGQDIETTNYWFPRTIPISNGGYNFIGNNQTVEATFPAGTPSGTSFAGTPAAPLDPKLLPLADNGGPTGTCAIADGSLLLNAGDPAVTASPTLYDQRGPGFPRVIGGRMDIGAFEARTLSVVVAPQFPATFAENAANPATTVRVIRTGATAQDLTVTLGKTAGAHLRVPATVVIPAGQAFVDVPVTALDNTTIDGTTEAVVTASAPGYAYLYNSLGLLRITDDEPKPSLAAVLSPTAFPENRSTTVSLVVSHNRSGVSTPVPLTLSCVDARLSWPANVTIPAGARKVTVPITVTPDPAVQGTVSPKITIAAPGFNSTAATATIYDDEAAIAVAVTPGFPSTFSEGASSPATKIRVSRNTPTAASQLVDLAIVRGAGQVTIPAHATILAGQSFVDVNVAAVDDIDFEGTQSVKITARAANFPGIGTVTLSVLDNDPRPALAATFSPPAFYETATGAISLIVSHNRPSVTEPVTLVLSSADKRLGWPSSVTIPAGIRKINVPITVAPDATVQGTVVSKIAVAATGFTGDVAPAAIYDAEAKITLAVAPGSTATFSEGAGSTATVLRVSRNTPTTAAVPVNLTLRRGTGQVTVRPAITIPLGQAFIDVPVAAVDDTVIDGTQQVIIDGKTVGYTGGSVSLSVLDNDGAALRAVPLSPLTLSSVSASAAQHTVTLIFTGPLGASANDAANYAVTANGAEVTVQSAAPQSGTTVVLQVDALSAGEALTISYDLADADGGILQGTAKVTVK
jgi:CSLREA domain-containing protein/uncharacterized repeat protein (TIGR01451 family)/prepilin-type N-terminal cleavage/methylation domain-containing protein